MSVVSANAADVHGASGHPRKRTRLENVALAPPIKTEASTGLAAQPAAVSDGNLGTLGLSGVGVGVQGKADGPLGADCNRSSPSSGAACGDLSIAQIPDITIDRSEASTSHGVAGNNALGIHHSAPSLPGSERLTGSTTAPICADADVSLSVPSDRGLGASDAHAQAPAQHASTVNASGIVDPLLAQALQGKLLPIDSSYQISGAGPDSTLNPLLSAVPAGGGGTGGGIGSVQQLEPRKSSCCLL